MRLTRTPFLTLAATAAALPLLVSSGATYAAAGDVWAVTKEGDGPAARAAVPDGGMRAFFSSTATTVVPGDTNGLSDAFWSHRDGTVRKVSSAKGGGDANGVSGDVSVSADGNRMVFASTAWNIGTWSSDHNEKRDVYLCPTGPQANPTACRTLGWTASGMEPNNHSMHPRISADGRWAVFASDASNWVKGDTNGVRDVFRVQVSSGTVTRVSVAANGAQLTRPSDYPSVSSDGRLVTFATAAAGVPRDTNARTDVYLRDLASARTSLVSQSRDEKIANGSSGSASVTRRCVDGTCFPSVVFTSHASNLVPGDTNGARDVFIRERGSTGRVSVSQAGAQGLSGESSWGPAISADGRYVAFSSDADLTGVLEEASEHSQVLLRDRTNGSVRLVSRTALLGPADGDSSSVTISPNGRYVAFLSRATDLDDVDTDNGTWDVFVAQLS